MPRAEEPRRGVAERERAARGERARRARAPREPRRHPHASATQQAEAADVERAPRERRRSAEAAEAGRRRAPNGARARAPGPAREGRRRARRRKSAARASRGRGSGGAAEARRGRPPERERERESGGERERERLRREAEAAQARARRRRRRERARRRGGGGGGARAPGGRRRRRRPPPPKRSVSRQEEAAAAAAPPPPRRRRRAAAATAAAARERTAAAAAAADAAASARGTDAGGARFEPPTTTMTQIHRLPDDDGEMEPSSTSRCRAPRERESAPRAVGADDGGARNSRASTPPRPDARDVTALGAPTPGRRSRGDRRARRSSVRPLLEPRLRLPERRRARQRTAVSTRRDGRGRCGRRCGDERTRGAGGDATTRMDPRRRVGARRRDQRPPPRRARPISAPSRTVPRARAACSAAGAASSTRGVAQREEKCVGALLSRCMRATRADGHRVDAPSAPRCERVRRANENALRLDQLVVLGSPRRQRARPRRDGPASRCSCAGYCGLGGLPPCVGEGDCSAASSCRGRGAPSASARGSPPLMRPAATRTLQTQAAGGAHAAAHTGAAPPASADGGGAPAVLPSTRTASVTSAKSKLARAGFSWVAAAPEARAAGAAPSSSSEKRARAQDLRTHSRARRRDRRMSGVGIWLRSVAGGSTSS